MQCYGVRRDKLTAKRGQDLLLLFFYCQLQFCVRSCRGGGGCTWVKSSGVNNDVIVVGKLFWRTLAYAFRHEQRIINKLGRHNDAANVT